MKQFLNGSQEAFRDLESRARKSCVRYRDQEMPPGCRPERADVGFEFDSANGTPRLCVQHGIAYSGSNPELGGWFFSGKKDFPDFAALIQWIKDNLGAGFGTRPVSGSEVVTSSPSVETAHSLTDLPTVLRGVRESHRPLYLDQDVLFERLAQCVRGQDNALHSLAAVITRHCARQHPKRPAVLFAVGPSGVGKTRTAETLAETLREMNPDSSGYGFLRLDMSEYQESHRVSQLIGSPQGYVGHGEGSQLLDALRANPKTIVLFDEIEKAHPAILRVLMNAMDAGRLSSASRSGSGHEIDCRGAVFLFTSNLDARAIIAELESSGGFGDQTAVDAICRRKLQASGIAPEIVGRIGRFLVFRPLTTAIRAEIMAGAIVDVAAEYGIRVVYVEPAVIVDVMKCSRSDDLGMRPVQYMIDDLLGAAFATAARKESTDPYLLQGPPYECVPFLPVGEGPPPALTPKSDTKLPPKIHPPCSPLN